MSTQPLSSLPLAYCTDSAGMHPAHTLPLKLQSIAGAGFPLVELAFPDLEAYAASQHPGYHKLDNAGRGDLHTLVQVARDVRGMCDGLRVKVFAVHPCVAARVGENGKRLTGRAQVLAVRGVQGPAEARGGHAARARVVQGAQRPRLRHAPSRLVQRARRRHLRLVRRHGARPPRARGRGCHAGPAHPHRVRALGLGDVRQHVGTHLGSLQTRRQAQLRALPRHLPDLRPRLRRPHRPPRAPPRPHANPLRLPLPPRAHPPPLVDLLPPDLRRQRPAEPALLPPPARQGREGAGRRRALRVEQPVAARAVDGRVRRARRVGREQLRGVLARRGRDKRGRAHGVARGVLVRGVLRARHAQARRGGAAPVGERRAGEPQAHLERAGEPGGGVRAFGRGRRVEAGGWMYECFG